MALSPPVATRPEPVPLSDFIRVRGARTHNLRELNVDLPRNQLIVVTGLSGSGKSSLVFDTLYAEGQRRYVESLSAYARQFLSLMQKPDVDHIEGLSPAISIEQKSTSHNPRSTVGTITEIQDYLRLLFARTGEPRCPRHGERLAGRSIGEMVDAISQLDSERRWMLLAPVVRDRKGEHLHALEDLRRGGFVRARIDGILVDLDQAPTMDKRRKHSIEAVVDRFRIRSGQQSRLAESLETALRVGDGLVQVAPMDGDGETLRLSSLYACPECGYSIPEMEPRFFSFNNPAGACRDCDGLGVSRFFDAERVVVPEATLAEGAIRGWDRNTFYFQILRSLSEHYSFRMDIPFRRLARRHQRLVLDGSGDEVVVLRRVAENGRVYRRRTRFEGVLPNLERRYRETESERLREELLRFISTRPCPSCEGGRLREEARHVFIGDANLPQLTALPVDEALDYFEQLHLAGHRGEIAEKILQEIRSRLRFLADVGLGYLSLERRAESLSGGEAQRIRLASQIGAGLVGVLYTLDEPSIGLHPRDNNRLLHTLRRLRDLGNTVVVVEHDEEAIRSADYVIDIGPGAGAAGGLVVGSGTPQALADSPDSLTGRYLSGSECIPLPKRRRQRDEQRQLVVEGASGNNLCAVDLRLPLGLFCCVTGVSGSGKSTLINQTLYPAVAARLLRQSVAPRAMPFKRAVGLAALDKCVSIDQGPIGRTPRSNPSTYTGLFTPVRELFAATREARARGYKPGRFSFNVPGGRCETCHGDGLIKVAMHFLPDIYVSCETCGGQRYNRETLEVRYKDRNIHEVLEMTVAEAREFFDPVPMLARRLQTLVDVGLSYICLGQAATTLSGGEAQRVKLSRELSRRSTGRTLYLLDEPTTGLHFHDVRQLLSVLHRLCDQGNTVVVIEHNLDVIKTADWIIDLGPEGGKDGGRVVAAGPPEEVAACEASHTGVFLRRTLASRRRRRR